MTCIFILVVLQVVKHNGTPSMPLNAFTISCALYFCISSAANITGGCINPAVGLVQIGFMLFYDKNVYSAVYPELDLQYWPAYALGPAVGGILAGIFSRYVHEAAIARADEARDGDDLVAPSPQVARP